MTGPTAPHPDDPPRRGATAPADSHDAAEGVPRHLWRAWRSGDITDDDIAMVARIRAAAPEWPPPIKATGNQVPRCTRRWPGTEDGDGAPPAPGATEDGASTS